MKKILLLTTILLTTIFCCMCLAVNAGETFRYTDYGGCTLVTKHSTYWLGGESTSYGLLKNGVEVLPPDCDVWYDAELRILTFRRCVEVISSKYQLLLYSADSGKCLYSGYYYAENNGHHMPYVTFENSGKYRNAIVHYYNLRYGDRQGNARKTIGSFFRKDGKLYQVMEKQVKYEAPVE